MTQYPTKALFAGLGRLESVVDLGLNMFRAYQLWDFRMATTLVVGVSISSTMLTNLLTVTSTGI